MVALWILTSNSHQQQMLDMQARLDALEHRKGGPVKKEVKRELVATTSKPSYRMDSNGVIDLSED